MKYTNSVKNRKILEALPNHSIGEIIYIEDEDKFMTYTEESIWAELDTSKLNVTNEGLTMTEYDLCKMSLASAKTLTKEELQDLKSEINDWGCKKSKCYLLYGQEKHIFDIFCSGFVTVEDPEFNSLADALYEILEPFGEIYRIDFGDSGLEIWIKYKETEEPTFLMLMPWGIAIYDE